MHTPRVVVSFTSAKFEHDSRRDSLVLSPNLKNPSTYLDLTIILESTDYHHLANVLKVSLGESFSIFDKDSCRDFTATVVKIDKKTLQAKLTAVAKKQKTFPITVIVGAPKLNICDEIVEKCVELGVPQIVFFVAERTQSKLSQATLESRIKRFQRIIEAALKQSGALGIWPEITFHEDLSGALKNLYPPETVTGGNSKRFVFTADGYDCKPGQTPLITEYFQSNKELNFNSKNSIEQLENTEDFADFNIVIGPEGGLSEKELKLLANYRFRASSLGERVLRTHTAVVAAVSYIKLAAMSA